MGFPPDFIRAYRSDAIKVKRCHDVGNGCLPADADRAEAWRQRR
jgi:hypothetical protein